MAGLTDRLSRWLRGAPTGRWIGARLGAGYIRLCWATTRWRVEGRENLDAALAEGGPLIAALWHGRLFYSPLWAPRGRRTWAMISQNKDGELICDIVARFGVEAVRGSTSNPDKRDRDKGGKQAYERGAAALRAGDVLAITPDGPRGPRMRAQPGSATLAIAHGALTIPVAFAARRAKVLGSWDRFLFPVPFDRGVLIYGPLVRPPVSGDAEAHRGAIEEALNAVTRRADEMAGRDPVLPAGS